MSCSVRGEGALGYAVGQLSVLFSFKHQLIQFSFICLNQRERKIMLLFQCNEETESPFANPSITKHVKVNSTSICLRY